MRTQILTVTKGTALGQSLGGGYYLLTQQGRDIVELALTAPVAVYVENKFSAMITRDMVLPTPCTTGGLPIWEVRSEGMVAFRAIQDGKQITEKKSLRDAHKALTRKGLVRGIDGLGHANPLLKKYEVGLSKEMLEQSRLVAGQKVLVTRIPQGSGTASLIEVTVQLVDEEGISLSPELAILLGGDFDSDRYYIYQEKKKRMGTIREVNYTVEDLFCIAERPLVGDNLPKRKVTVGTQDRLQVKAREVVGIFTDMGYSAVQTATSANQSRKLADKWFPSQELIFDLKKIDIDADIVSSLSGIMTTPLRYRYTAMAEFASTVKRQLEALNAEKYYIEAFAWLAEASEIAQGNIDEMISLLYKERQNELLEVDERDYLNKAVYLEPGIVPDMRYLDLLIRGEGAPWFSTSFSNLLAKERGTSSVKHEETVKCSLFDRHPLLVGRWKKAIPEQAYILGNSESNLAVIWTGTAVEVYIQFEKGCNMLESVEVQLHQDVELAPAMSGKLLTGVVANSKVVNALVTAEGGVENPLKTLRRLIQVAMDKSFGKNEYLRDHLLSRRSMPGVYQAIRAAIREWFKGADPVCREADGIAYQLKAIRIEDGGDMDALQRMIGEDWEFRSTKNGDKGHILPKPGTELHQELMDLWYRASAKNAELMPAHRVNSEQLPSHHRGRGMAYVLVWDIPGLTYGTTASSFDALKMELGMEGEKGISATDSSILFRQTTFHKSIAMYANNIADHETNCKTIRDMNYPLETRRECVTLRGINGEVLPVEDSGTTYPGMTLYTALGRVQDNTKVGHSYKMMFGPGAKGMFTYKPTKVEALIGGELEPITAAISMTSLKSKNALQACLDGIDRLGVEGDQFPVYLEGREVGNFSILKVPYWMLPADTESTQCRMEPWVAPVANASQNKDKVKVISPEGNLQKYLETVVPHVLLGVQTEYLENCEKLGIEPDFAEIKKLQLQRLNNLLRGEVDCK